MYTLTYIRQINRQLQRCSIAELDYIPLCTTRCIRLLFIPVWQRLRLLILFFRWTSYIIEVNVYVDVEPKHRNQLFDACIFAMNNRILPCAWGVGVCCHDSKHYIMRSMWCLWNVVPSNNNWKINTCSQVAYVGTPLIFYIYCVRYEFCIFQYTSLFFFFSFLSLFFPLFLYFFLSLSFSFFFSLALPLPLHIPFSISFFFFLPFIFLFHVDIDKVLNS